jgi:hypothetical protein
LRDTIKKEDAAIQELKFKLDIAFKKVEALGNMLEGKDDDIKVWMERVAVAEGDLAEYRGRHG